MWCLCMGLFMLRFVSISVSAAVIGSSKNHSYQFGPSFLTLGTEAIYGYSVVQDTTFWAIRFAKVC